MEKSAKTAATPKYSLELIQHILGDLLEHLLGELAQQAAMHGERDLLLPRLISGQLSVASAERELEKVA